MTLRLEAKKRDASLVYAEQRRAAEVEKARAMFAETFGEEPQQISYCGKRFETHDGTGHVMVRIEHDGVSFGTTYGRSGSVQLNVILTCPECGREFVSRGTVYTFGDHGRDKAIESLADVLTETRKSWTRHQCRGNLLKPLARQIQDVADQLKISVYEVVEGTYEHMR